MTWKVLTIDTRKVLYWSQIRLFSTQDINLRAGLIEGEDDPLLKTRFLILLNFDQISMGILFSSKPTRRFSAHTTSLDARSSNTPRPKARNTESKLSVS